MKSTQEFETRQIGNMLPKDIHDTDGSKYGPELSGQSVPSLVSQWAMQGITYEVTAPQATKRYTSEQLSGMGLVGVTIYVPLPNPNEQNV